MSDASIDQNFVKTALAVLNTDGVTLVPIKINESNGGMLTNIMDTISFTMTPISKIDQNFWPTLMWEGTDGLMYPFVANADGEVLIEQ